MKNHSKIELSVTMLEEAEKIYLSASSQIDYIKSILLSGSVLGIIEPLLESKEIETTHKKKVKLLNYIFKKNEHKGVFKSLYNSLKHTGNRAKNIEAWNDTDFEGDLPTNAKYLLNAAKKDMHKLKELFK